MVGHQQPTPVYTQPVCFAPNMMYPVPVSPGVQVKRSVCCKLVNAFQIIIVSELRRLRRSKLKQWDVTACIITVVNMGTITLLLSFSYVNTDFSQCSLDLSVPIVSNASKSQQLSLTFIVNSGRLPPQSSKHSLILLSFKRLFLRPWLPAVSH